MFALIYIKAKTFNIKAKTLTPLIGHHAVFGLTAVCSGHIVLGSLGLPAEPVTVDYVF